MKLYFHPISTYSQKARIALEEKGASFTPEIVNIMDPAARAAYKKGVNPQGKVPMLVLDDGWKIPESTIIIEYLEGELTSGTKLIPADKTLARRTRFMDRMADLYLNEPMTTILFDGMKPEADREPKRVAAAKATLDTNYELLDQGLSKSKGPWLLDEHFTMADCSAAPCLFYLRTVYPYASYRNIEAYWNRLAERPSVKKVIGEATPYLAKMMGK